MTPADHIMAAARKRWPTPSLDADTMGISIAQHANGCEHRLAAMLDAVAACARQRFNEAQARDVARDARRAGL
jgi:hypothetical protein